MCAYVCAQEQLLIDRALYKYFIIITINYVTLKKTPS